MTQDLTQFVIILAIMTCLVVAGGADMNEGFEMAFPGFFRREQIDQRDEAALLAQVGDRLCIFRLIVVKCGQ